MAIQNLRSAVANKRPVASSMSDGQIAVNTNATSTGVFFKDASGNLIKAGPASVGTSAPNSSPAGSSGNSIGEIWLDTTGGNYVVKVWDGSAWQASGIASGTAINASTLDVTGDATIADKIIHSGDTNTAIRFPAVDTFAIETDGTERIRVTSTGALAIEGASNYGTSGQVLTSNANDAPTWQDAGGGSWNLIATVNASSAATVTFQGNLDSTYTNYVVLINDVTNGGTNQSGLRMSHMVGATVLSSANYDTVAVRRTKSSATVSGLNRINQTKGEVSTAQMLTSTYPDHFLDATVWLTGGKNAKGHFSFFESALSLGGTYLFYDDGAIEYLDSTAQAVDGVQFSMSNSSDTINGTFKLYGLT